MWVDFFLLQFEEWSDHFKSKWWKRNRRVEGEVRVSPRITQWMSIIHFETRPGYKWVTRVIREDHSSLLLLSCISANASEWMERCFRLLFRRIPPFTFQHRSKETVGRTPVPVSVILVMLLTKHSVPVINWKHSSDTSHWSSVSLWFFRLAGRCTTPAATSLCD